MPGFELFDDEEKRQVNEVMKTGILFRYGFDEIRKGICKTKEFEKELSKKLNVKYSHLCSSGTSALTAALVACGIGVDDEVIVPPFTFVATIESILLIGAIPIFSEIDETLCLNPDNIEPVLTTKTKAVMPVHMCGAMARIDEIKLFCKKNSLFLIEDACQSIGATYNKKTIGSFGEAGCFSFDFVKTITCGEGGAVITNNEKIYSKISSFTDHGHDHLGFDRGVEDHTVIGTNSRISELNAAIGVAQLKKIDKIIRIQRNNKEIIKNKIKKIKNIKLRELPDKKGDSATFLSFFLPNAEKAKLVISELKKKNINDCFYWFEHKWHYIKNWDHIKSIKSYMKLPASNKYEKFSNPILDRSNSIMERTVSIQIKVGWNDEKVNKIADNLAKILKNIS